jgi:hypothetical protein
MAASSAIVEGPVLLVTNRSGVSNRDPQNPRAYSITTARVLVADSGICDVQIADTIKTPVQGEDVRYLVDLGTYSGQLSVRAVADLARA